jgi:replicative DNA helicase
MTQDPTVEDAMLWKPPYNAEAEQSVLGGIFLDNLAYDLVVGVLSEQDFYVREHRLIFRAQCHLLNDSKPVDIITVADFLEGHRLLEEAGGLKFLGELALNTPTAANIWRYAEIVRDHSLLRSMAQICGEISDKVHKRGGLSAKELLDFAQGRWMSVGESMAKDTHSMLPVSEVMTRVLAQLDELFNNPNQSDITGLPSGLTDLDKLTTGFQPGELVILAGRPSMGKTSLALNIVEHVALHEKKNVAFFSLEMINAQLGVRLLSSVSRVNQQRVKVARLSEDEWVSVADAAEVLRASNIYLDEESSLSVNELRARSRRLHRECEGGLHLIVVDYIGLMELATNSDNRAIGVAEISRALKLLAKELHVPVLALSQLNRGLESRPNKRPIMSDLRDSGGIEQDADTILFVYRDEVYNEDTPDKGIAEIIVGKQRNGPIGTVHTTFIGHLMRFENLAAGVAIPSQEARAERNFKRANSRGNFRPKNQAGEEVDL